MGNGGRTHDGRWRPLMVAAMVTMATLVACGGDDSNFPEAQRGKVVEYFDAAGDAFDFSADRQYVSAVAAAPDGTLYVAVADRFRKAEGTDYRVQDRDNGRVYSVPRSGKAKEVARGTAAAMTVSADGTLLRRLRRSVRREPDVHPRRRGTAPDRVRGLLGRCGTPSVRTSTAPPTAIVTAWPGSTPTARSSSCRDPMGPTSPTPSPSTAGATPTGSPGASTTSTSPAMPSPRSAVT